MARKTTTPTFTASDRRRVFVDTSGWYAVASERDRYHEAAVHYFDGLAAGTAHLITSDYVLDETLTRLRYDFGHNVAMTFWGNLRQAQHTGFLTLVWANQAVFHDALSIFDRYDDQQFSFTDCTSFTLAMSLGVDEVFAFDEHFRMFGLVVQPVP